MKYYKLDAKNTHKILKLSEQLSQQVKKAKEIAKQLEIPVTDIYTVQTSMDVTISGIKAKPDWKPKNNKIVKLKNAENGWRPRKDNSKLSKEFYSLRTPIIDEVRQIINAPFISKNAHLFSCGITIQNGDVYISLQDEIKPENCKRISDIEMEKICGP